MKLPHVPRGPRPEPGRWWGSILPISCGRGKEDEDDDDDDAGGCGGCGCGCADDDDDDIS